MSTHPIRDHIASCILAKRVKLQRAKESDDSIDSPSSPIRERFDAHDRPTMTRKLLSEKVLRIIAAGNLPFSFAENPEFVALLKHAWPDIKAPSRRSTRDLLGDKVDDCRVELRERFQSLDSKISLSLDAWRSRGNIEFLGKFLLLACNGKVHTTLRLQRYPITYFNMS